MKKIILTVIAVSLVVLTHAQSFEDNALLFSRIRPGGSARIQALGGSQVSLGGDYSSAYSNPAGLGMFNRSEFTITPAMNFTNTSSTYFGEKTGKTKSTFNLPGLSLVIRFPSDKDEGFLGGSLGITLNRVNDFNQSYQYSGTNSQNSLIHYFLDDANGVYFNNQIIDPASMDFGQDNFYNLTGLAFNNYLIDTLRDNNGQLYYDSPLNVYWTNDGKSSVRQTESSKRSGSQYQWSIAYGANFSDKFFVGATLGITSLRFKLRQTYQESDFAFGAAPQGFDPLSGYEVEENYNITGSGVNFGLGMIYRPVNFIQIGASFTTPTFYQITDHYDAKITSHWNPDFDYYGDGEFLPDPDDVNEKFDQPVLSEYNLSTPMRLSTGATFISKIGFVSADVEFVNYARAKYSTDMSEGFESENSNIKAEYQSVINYRLGAEYRYQKFRVRGGFNYMTDPLVNSNTNIGQTGFSGGLGFRDKHFFVDLASTYTQTKGTRIPYYAAGGDPIANQKFKYNNFLVTVGFTF
jgi:hypothetical protein